MAGVSSEINDESERSRLKFSTTSNCPVCGAIVEDVDHILRRCPLAMSVWNAMIPPTVLNQFMNLGLHEWMIRNLAGSSLFGRGTENWGTLFAYILWRLWLVRNSFIFNKGMIGRGSVVDRSKHLIMLSSCTEGVNSSAWLAGRNTCAVTQRWRPPEQHWLQINLDGSRCCTMGLAKCGGAARNEEGVGALAFRNSSAFVRCLMLNYGVLITLWSMLGITIAGR
ncbi:hypothetical protein F3Y22_tig00110847pilonHSYRG00221 [Hibiscus syriacus]|uniref:Reverse transcriptase zinc-binding domain-containing protein n=1 Tax=Hibiscus syriacus TaxID=106335 RepID=A0A6A2ZN02_HIBSY|nr:hypothetical protein F3Y22_tig00110847pilonHSYRG00221 [Hibiscus syriacus]